LKKLLLVTNFIFCILSNSYANENCEFEARSMGNGVTPSYISLVCRQYFISQSLFFGGPFYARDRIYYPYKNIITINEKGIYTYLAGKGTGLESVVALTMNTDQTKLFILDSKKQAILVFDAKSSGNIEPLYSMTSMELVDASSIVYSDLNQELLVSVGSEGNILVFPSVFNQDRNSNENIIKSTRVLGGINSGILEATSMMHVLNKNELWVADKIANQILVFNFEKFAFNSPPIRIIKANSQNKIQYPIVLYYDQVSGLVKFMNQNGDSFYIK
jgi:hypothetical protein